MSKSNNIEVKNNQYIDWVYPEIYDKKKPNWLEINLIHTRATDGIRIKYDAGRDGWVIEQASVFHWDVNDSECDSNWQEVAFVKAWKREQKGVQ